MKYRLSRSFWIWRTGGSFCCSCSAAAAMERPPTTRSAVASTVRLISPLSSLSKSLSGSGNLRDGNRKRRPRSSTLRNGAVGRHLVDRLRQNLRQLLHQFLDGHARFLGELPQQVGPEGVVHVSRRDRLIRS